MRAIKPICLLLVVSFGRTAMRAGHAENDILPMHKGSYWIYRGEVAWAGSGETAPAHKKTVTWKMEIADSAQRGRYTVALVLGHPKDLTWYEEGRERQCSLLIAVDAAKFFLGACGGKPGEIHGLPQGDIAPSLARAELFFKYPLQADEVFGGDPSVQRDDTMYAWMVQAVRPARLRGIKGVQASGKRMEYELTYRTMPDHQIETYVPGIGLTRYVYSHHGTTSEVDVRLVEFHVGSE
ncbi:MAG: hypothetical protein U0Q18_21930 [Bryobacteraceae bacterium]